MKLNVQDSEKELLAITQQFLNESGEEFQQRKVTIDASLQRHLGIDSLGRAELFSRIEKQFDILLPQQLLADADNLQDIFQAILSAKPHTYHHEPGVISKPIEEIIIDTTSTQTLIDVLLLYAIQAPERPHIYFQDENGKEEIITYGKLLDNALRIAASLIQRGLRHGDTIAIMLPTDPSFFYVFFGVLIAGCIPVPIYPPFRPNQIESYAKQEAGILRNAEVRMLVTFQQAEKLSKLLRAFIPSLKEITTVDSLLKTNDKAPIHRGKGDDFALIQYTSGSTSAPKGVLLSYQNLLANIRAYGEAIQVKPNDVAVSWVPLYHDLGLIGMWFGSLYHGIPLVIMSPLTFLTRPERWLWAMHYHRGTLSGGPNFAYELCVRKIDPAQIEGLDLSSWRLAANGAEAIHPKTLMRFSEKFIPFGFNPKAHFPVYGLAESSVCVATSPLNRGVRIDKIEREIFETQGKAIPTDDSSKNTLEFVACGKAIPNHEMRIVDDEGNVLPERHVGNLQFKGPSSMQGYYGNPEATRKIFHEGWWDTGDVAYLSEEEVFITGRKKDLIIKAGRNLYPAEIEDLAAQVPEIRKGCVISFGITDTERGTEKLIVVAETKEKNKEKREQIIAQINEKIATTLDITPDHVVLVNPGTIPKTSSGKLQRVACRNAYLQGKLSKRGLPFWMQLFKLGISFSRVKIFNQLKYLAKLFYTSYAVSLVAITIFPVWLSLFIFPRKVAAHICKSWANIIAFLGFCPIRIKDQKNLYSKQPMIFTCNHSSYADALFMLAIVPAGTRLIGKSEIKDTPIVRTFLKKLGFVAVDRSDAAKGIEDTQEILNLLKEGHSVMIFPEGTFSYAAGLRPFKLGAFKLAASTQIPICAMAMQGTREIMRGEEKLLRPHRVNVFVNKPISIQGSDWQEVTRLKNEVRALIAKDCGEPTLDMLTTAVAKTRKELQ